MAAGSASGGQVNGVSKIETPRQALQADMVLMMLAASSVLIIRYI